MSAKLYSMRFAINVSFSEKRSVLMKMCLCFENRFIAVKNICKNRLICIKDNAPTILTCESIYPLNTAHTISSRGGEPRWQSRGILEDIRYGPD